MKTISISATVSLWLTVLLLAWLPSAARGAISLTTLYTFANPTNGFRPNAGLVQGADGNLYGTTDKGGTSYSPTSNSFGTIFSITTNGAFTSLHSFSNGVDGGPHISELVQGTDGKFYGTTQNGGLNSYGSIFSLTTNGTFTTLFSFPAFQGAPQAPLIQGADGSFYGTTRSGGSNYLGSVFRFTVTPSVTCTDLYSFQGTNDGYQPAAGLVQGSNGILYGTTQFGGSLNRGSIFGISTNGGPLVLVHLFQNNGDGAGPQGGLVQGPDGKLYGTAATQISGGTGTVFSITTSGTFATLHSFTGGTNGALPLAGLTLASDNKFYGITSGTSLTNSGTIYSIDTNGVYTVLFNFDYAEKTNGQVAVSSPLIQGADGSFYGTTSYGGSTNNAGSIFKFSVTASSSSPPTITVQPFSLSNFIGSAVAFSVSADNATAFQWFKGSAKVADNSRISGAATGTLTISNLAAADAGTYHAVVSNLTSSVASSNVTLTVLVPDTTRPTLTVTSPHTGLSVTNSQFTATGTAKDSAAIATVFYQVNGGDWIVANGTTNWSATTMLDPGANTFRFYAVDTSTNYSVTNSAIVTYIVVTPVAIHIVGQGTVTVGKNKFTSADNLPLLQIGTTYKLAVKAAKGFAFQNWTGSVSTNASKLSFVAGSNLTFTATFVDVARPLAVIKFPAVNKTVTNTPFAATGRASDNVGVTGVWFQPNNWGWYPASTTDGWTNWTTSNFALNSGPNVVQAYATDAAGNVSTTNSVKFIYKILPVTDWAPDSLNGLLGQVQPSNGAPILVAFDPANFSQTGASTTNIDDFGVGNYVYTKLATNLAMLTITNSGPPPQTNTAELALTFTNHYSGVYSNADGDTGTLAFSIATSFAPATLAKKTIVAVDDANGNVSTIKLTDATHFTRTSTLGGTGSGTYMLNRFSPVSVVMLFNYTDGTYVEAQLTFNSAKGGTYFAAFFGLSGPPPSLSGGTFTLH